MFGDVTLAGPEYPSPDRIKQLGFAVEELQILRMTSGEVSERSADFEILVYQTLRIPPRTSAHNSFLIIQFPFESVGPRSILRHPRSRLRSPFPLRNLQGYCCIVYSEFVRYWVQKRWHKDAKILPPPVRTARRALSSGGQIILSVARFHGGAEFKRHDVLIEAYRRLPDRIQKQWRLVIVGGSENDEATQTYIKALRRSADGVNVEIKPDVSQDELNSLYERSSLFWHAAGYGRSIKHPEHAEHFGMATVEAMSHGIIPMAYADGGQVEIVRAASGVLWTTIDQLVNATSDLVDNVTERRRRSQECIGASSAYSVDKFDKRFHAVFQGLGGADMQVNAP